MDTAVANVWWFLQFVTNQYLKLLAMLVALYYGWITPVAGVAGKVPIIAGCDYYYECRVIYSADLKLEELPPEIKAKCYPSDDAHKLYFGEILAAYKG